MVPRPWITPKASVSPWGHQKSRASSLLDHLIGPLEEQRGDRQAERLRGFQIDYQLELGGLLHRELSRPGAFEDLVDIRGGGGLQADSIRVVLRSSRR